MDRSPAFVPPQTTVKDTDPLVSKVPMDRMDWGARKVSQPSFQEGLPPIKHVPNGQ